MAAGDINDPLSQIPGIALADDSTDPTDLGSGYALLKFKNGQMIWLPTGGSLTHALDDLTPGQVHGITEKAVPVATDVLLIEDSASSWAKKRVPWSALPGAGSLAVALLLNYNLASDLSPLTLTAQTWVDVFANQSFTPNSGTSVIFALLTFGADGNAVVINNFGARLAFDTGGTPAYVMIGGGVLPATGDSSTAPGSGAVVVGPFTAAAHTVKLQVRSNWTADGALYCRASTLPDAEFCRLQIVEFYTQ